MNQGSISGGRVMNEFGFSDDKGTRDGKSIKEDWPFDRDCARIISSRSFRRLKHKTQVFHAPRGDHFRTRLTHTMEVAQVSLQMARALKLNDDLARAIGLAHDLGQPPFGHAGERALKECLKPFGRNFEHNAQSVKVVTKLAGKKIPPEGMGLTDQVVDGLACHPYSSPKPPETLEGWVVRIADDVTYISHDYDDLREAKLPVATEVRKALTALGRNLEERVQVTIEDVRGNFSQGAKELTLSPDLDSKWQRARKALRQYHREFPAIQRRDKSAEYIVSRIFNFLMELKNHERREYLSQTGIYRIEELGEPEEEVIVDHIAGMTDTYALDRYWHGLLAPHVAEYEF